MRVEGHPGAGTDPDPAAGRLSEHVNTFQITRRSINVRCSILRLWARIPLPSLILLLEMTNENLGAVLVDHSTIYYRRGARGRGAGRHPP